MTIKQMIEQANGEIKVIQTRTGCYVYRRGQTMELTIKETLEVAEFSAKYPTITKIFTLLEKRIDDMDDEISKLKKEVSKIKG